MEITDEVRGLADSVAAKLKAGYNFPHALHSALKEKRKELPAEEFEILFYKVQQELRRRAQARRRAIRKQGQEEAKKQGAELEEITRSERRREARRMAHERRDYDLSDP